VQRTLEDKYAPYRGPIPKLITAQERAGINEYGEAHGPFIDLRRAAELAPLIRDMYGLEGPVTRFPWGVVLRELKADTDGARLQDWTSLELGKIHEAEVKAKTKRK